MAGVSRRSLLRAGAALGVLGGIGSAPAIVRAAAPVLRLGYGAAASEQVLLLVARPELCRNRGKLYELDAVAFQSSTQLAQALEANAIDLTSGGAPGAIAAAASGSEVRMIASVARESSQGFTTPFLTRASSGIRTVPDMKGKVVGVNGLGTNGHLWLVAALKRHGMTDQDVRVTAVPMPAIEESLKAGRIDVGMFPQPFFAMMDKGLETHKVFDAKYGMPFDEELIVISGKHGFLKRNAGPVRAFLEDLRLVTGFYLTRTREARQMLIDARMVRVPAETYLGMADYYRDPSCRIDAGAVAKTQDAQVEAGMLSKRVEIDRLVDPSYIAG
jgi:ABC-type nitrate/sulfonate/bicarbonate transport system substrate-binding protein